MNTFNFRSRIIFVFSILMFFFKAEAHETIVGKVVDQNTNSPIWGASIYIEGTGLGTTSDELGKFVLILDSIVDEVQVSYIGYQTANFKISHGENHLFSIEKSALKLNEIAVTGGSSLTTQSLSSLDLELKAVNSSQEILRSVPGLFIGQHAGGGKAEQIFLRGYDIDHGTDISISVDGLPVNMVSHAHGQGYSDLHFLIPELISKVEFDKGPYYANQGDFATAGFVNFATKSSLKQNRVQMEAGSFKTFRVLGMVNLLSEKFSQTKKQDAFIATEFLSSDGPFESPQDFTRFNIFYKHSFQLNEKIFLSFQTSHFKSSWNASGQIPDSAVENGVISRFGAIDSDEGGETSRTNASLKLTTYINEKTTLKTQAYYSNYNFTLFSNFTFFLEDSINGDRIKQQEFRNVYGANTALTHTTKKAKVKYITTAGLGFRQDVVKDNELLNVIGREVIVNQLSYGDIDESNVNLYGNQSFGINKWEFNVGLRLDYFNFRYTDKLQNEQKFTKSAAVINPKVAVIYNFTPAYQLYLKMGTGFHSNDARSAIYANKISEILPRVYGADLGTNLNIGKRVFVNIAAWNLFQENELVYVGDAGIVEENGQSIRAGVDFSTRIQLLDYLFLEGNFNYTYARSLEESKGENNIPLAPSLTSTGGLFFKHKTGFNSSLNYRFIADRPANGDYSLTAQGYTVFDFQLGYTQKKYELGVVVENLLNTKWREAQFETESRITPESVSTNEIHFTPGAPINIKAKVSFLF